MITHLLALEATGGVLLALRQSALQEVQAWGLAVAGCGGGPSVELPAWPPAGARGRRQRRVDHHWWHHQWSHQLHVMVAALPVVVQ